MPHVVLVNGFPDEGEEKTGIGMYVSVVENCLKSHGIQYDVVNFALDRKHGIKGIFKYGFIEPFFSILRHNGKDTIFHFTFEYNAMMMPFTVGRRVTTFHHYVEKDEGNQFVWYMFWRLGAWLSLRLSDKVIAISSLTATDIKNKAGVSNDRVVTITSSGVLKCHPNDGPKDTTVFAVGTLNKRKNFEATIRVFERFVRKNGMENYRLIICGDGPERENLIRQAEGLGIAENVCFISNISQDELVEHYRHAKILINTSLKEGIGLATLEAQMCSTPVVYIRGASIPEEVMRVALPCSDDDEMAETMYRLVIDDDYYSEISKAGVEYASHLADGFDKALLSAYGIE